MTSSPSPRRLTRADLPALVDLCREHARFENAPWYDYDRISDLASLFLMTDDAWCWVVDGEDRLDGFASAFLERSTWSAGRYLHMDCLFLRPNVRGRGLGRALLAEVARIAVDRGALEVQWQTPEWNGAAIRFYDRLGATSAEKLRFTLDIESCRRLGTVEAAPPMEKAPS